MVGKTGPIKWKDITQNEYVCVCVWIYIYIITYINYYICMCHFIKTCSGFKSRTDSFLPRESFLGLAFWDLPQSIPELWQFSWKKLETEIPWLVGASDAVSSRGVRQNPKAHRSGPRRAVMVYTQCVAIESTIKFRGTRFSGPAVRVGSSNKENQQMITVTGSLCLFWQKKVTQLA